MIVRKMRNSVQKAGLILVGVGAMSVSLAASADDYAVAYSPQELSSANGVEQIHERIVKAAKQYCPRYSQVRSSKEIKLCVDGVVQDLVDKVDHPQLTSLHQSGSAVSVAGSDVEMPAKRS